MARTRRSFIRGLAAFASLPAGFPAIARASEAATELEPAIVQDFESLLSRAGVSVPALQTRARTAVAGTLARLQDLAIDLRTPGRFILANIPAAEVIAYQDGREVLRSRAIVGAGRTRTPRLASIVPSVRLNPPWYVPASIEPTVNTASGLFRRVNGTLVQRPGPTNPLGPIRIGLEESQAVYLHGTSDPRLFARARRTLSHGCIRVERILELAAWVLDMRPEFLAALVATGRTRELVPPEEVRVALAYLTAWPAEDGRLLLHPDPYGLDRLPHRPVRRPAAPRPARPPMSAPEPILDGALDEST
jgi:murein L,D-transpeptidase YcbB/YkuD